MNPHRDWTSTEFWMTLATKVLTGLALFGVIAPADQQSLGDAAAKVIGGSALVIANVMLVAHYISSRLHLKSRAQDLNPQPETSREKP